MRRSRIEFLTAIHGASGPGYIEIRAFRGQEVRQRWARTPDEADAHAHALVMDGFEVFHGVARRRDRIGEARRAYNPARVVRVDCDSARSVHALSVFDPAPSAVVSSGRFDAGVPRCHAYWRLSLPTSEARRHNLRLATHLEADIATCDDARVLRLPGSPNSRPGARLARLVSLTDAVYSVEELTDGLPDPAPLAIVKSNPHGVGHGSRIVPAGERHNTLVSLLGVMRSWGAGAEALTAAAQAFALSQCDPPLDVGQARRVARDIAERYPPGPAQTYVRRSAR